MPQRNTRLALSRETPFDPLEIMELPDFNAERQSARRKFIQPGHFSDEILFDIASTVEGGGYVFGQNTNLDAGYLFPDKYSQISISEKMRLSGLMLAMSSS